MHKIFSKQLPGYKAINLVFIGSSLIEKSPEGNTYIYISTHMNGYGRYLIQDFII